MIRLIKNNKAYIIAAAIGLVLTPIAVVCAAFERGYAGVVGGEWLLVPLALLVAFGVRA